MIPVKMSFIKTKHPLLGCFKSKTTKMNSLKCITLLLSFTLLINCKKDIKGETLVQSISTIDRSKEISIDKNDVNVLDYNNEKAKKIIIPSDVLEEKHIKVEELFSNIDFTPLETTNKSLIGSINKIISDSNYYFIHDKRNNKLLRFNHEGKFLNSIGTIGKGPKEIISIGDVAINRRKKFVSILDYKLRKIVKYTYSGKYMESDPLFYVVSQHEYNDDSNNMIFSVSRVQRNTNIPAIDSYGLLLANKESIPFSVAFKNPENSFSNNTQNPLRRFGEEVYYHHPFSNGIWQIKDSLLKPVINFEYEKNGLSSEVWKKSLNNKEFDKLLDENILFSGDYVVSNNFWFFQVFTNNKQAGALFYNNNTGNLKYGIGLKYNKEMPLTFLVRYPEGIRDDGVFVSYIEAAQLFNIKQYFSKEEKLKKALKKKDWDEIEKIKQTDNPVIVTYKLKDF